MQACIDLDLSLLKAIFLTAILLAAIFWMANSFRSVVCIWLYNRDPGDPGSWLNIIHNKPTTLIE